MSVSDEYDEETVAASIFQDEHEKDLDEQSHPKTISSRRWIGVAAAIFLVLLIAVPVLYRDIQRTADRLEESPESLLVLDQAVVNVRPSSPVITSVLHVKASPRFSKIRLQDVACQLSSGSFHVQADYLSNEQYALTVTCPPEDADGHATFLREALTTNEVDLSVQCNIHLRVWVGRFLPVRKTVEYEYQWKTASTAASEEDYNALVEESLGEWGSDNDYPQQDENENTVQSESDHWYEQPNLGFPTLLDANSGETLESPSSTSMPAESPPSYTLSPGAVLLLDANSGKPVEGPSSTSMPEELPPYVPPDSDSDSETPVNDPSGSILDSSNQPLKSPENDPSGDLAPSISLESWGPEVLKVRVNWSVMPARSFIKSLKVLLPAVQVTVEPDFQDEDLVVTWDAFEATLFSMDTDESEESLLIEIACTSEKETCPWYKPVYKALFPTDNRPAHVGDSTFHKVVILVDASESFLENIIGDVHYWTAQNYMDSSSSALPDSYNSRRRLGSTSTLLPDLAEVASDCLRIAPDEDIAVEVAFCLGVDASSSDEGSVVSVCNMTFFETALVGTGVGEWTYESSQTEDVFQLLTAVTLVEPNAAADAAGTAKVDASGNFTLRLSDVEDEIEIFWNMDNDGSWFPFETKISMEGSALDDVLEMTLSDGTISLDGKQHLDQAQGSLVISTDTRSFEVSVTDATWNIQGVAQIEDNVVEVVDDPYAPAGTANGGTETVDYFRGNTTVQRDGDMLWDAKWVAKVWNTDYFTFSPDRSERYHDFVEMEFSETVEDSTVKIECAILSFETFGLETKTSEVEMHLDTFKIRLGGTQYMDSTGTTEIDIENSLFSFSASDPVRDLDVKVDLTWFSEGDKDILDSRRFNVSNRAETETYFGLAEGNLGTISDDGAKADLSLTSLPNSRFKVDGMLGYEWKETTDTFSASMTDLQMDWEDDALVDISGSIVLDLDEETIDIQLLDNAVQDFNVDMDMSWYGDSVDDWGIAAEKVFFERNAVVAVNNKVSFRLQPSQPSGPEIFVQENGNPTGVFETRSLSDATMELDMDMNFTFFEDSSFFQLLMDNCRMEYDGTVYIDIGRSFSRPATPPSSASPTIAPSAPPNTQTFEFSGITLFISEAIELSPQNIENLQAALEQFYELIYSDSSSRRKLQGADLKNFQTDVRIIDSDLTTEGNTITYDQSISFVPSDGQTVSGVGARDLLSDPFQDDAKKQNFLTILKDRDSTFASVQSVGSPNVPLPDNTVTDPPTQDGDDDDSSALLYGLIGGGVLLCCCCAGFSYMFVKRRGDTTRAIPEESGPGDKFFDEEQTGGGYIPSPLMTGNVEDVPPSNFQDHNFDKGETEDGWEDEASTSEDENSSEDDDESSDEESDSDESSGSDDSESDSE